MLSAQSSNLPFNSILLFSGCPSCGCLLRRYCSLRKAGLTNSWLAGSRTAGNSPASRRVLRVRHKFLGGHRSADMSNATEAYAYVHSKVQTWSQTTLKKFRTPEENTTRIQMPRLLVEPRHRCTKTTTNSSNHFLRINKGPSRVSLTFFQREHGEAVSIFSLATFLSLASSKELATRTPAQPCNACIA